MNQGDFDAQCSFISMNGADLNSQCISNAKRLFYETLPPKNHGKVSFVKKVYHDAVLVLFTATPTEITTDTNTGGKICSL